MWGYERESHIDCERGKLRTYMGLVYSTYQRLAFWVGSPVLIVVSELGLQTERMWTQESPNQEKQTL